MDSEQDELPTETTVEELAKREGVEAGDLDPPLGTVIDPDALNALCTSRNRDEPTREGFVWFVYVGYVVTVWFDGSVRIETE